MFLMMIIGSLFQRKRVSMFLILHRVVDNTNLQISLEYLRFGHFYILLFLISQYINLQLVMWRVPRLYILLILLISCSSSYLEFKLIRSQSQHKKFQLEPISCKNETTINQDAQYKEVCYQKDMAYYINFVKDQEILAMSPDFTAPLSWIKGPQCKVEGDQKPCKRIYSSITEKIKNTKKKIVNKFKKKSTDKGEIQNAIIEGSSQVIRGEFQQSKSIAFTTKDSNRLNNFFELIMLGLYWLGQKDRLQLESTNFINAIEISPNLNNLIDGAISMRFDSTSQNSFLNEIFTYTKTTQKTITVYLGQNDTMTIGDMTAKYTQSGYSSINWISMPDDEGFGKMAQVQDIGIDDQVEDTEGQEQDTLPVIFTLSASYIGLPEFVLNAIFSKYFAKNAKCKIDNKTSYAECAVTNKKNFTSLINKQVYFGFQSHNIVIPMKDLILKNQHDGKRVIFNIKRTFNNHVILGEPVFQRYVIMFDYSKDKIGFAPKREHFNQFFISVVSLVRFLCLVFIIGCSFIICYNPCRKMWRTINEKNWFTKGVGGEGSRLRQYAPIQQNPYDDLKGKIQDVISSTQKQVDGI